MKDLAKIFLSNDERTRVEETRCCACGDAACRFEIVRA